METTKLQPKNWQRTKVRDLLSGYIGGGWGNDSETTEFSEPAFVIRGTDIPDASVGDTHSLPFRYHKKSNIKSRKLNDSDIVFEVSGGSKGQWVGRSLIIKSKLLKKLNENVIPASFCKGLTPNSARVDSAFLYYFFQKIYQSDEISQWQTQSTGISNFKFEKFLDECFITLPPKLTQKQIADVLSAYDDLIENNTRRIQILEQMAQEIYKEWFVNFRFPGHEKAKSRSERSSTTGIKMIDSGTDFGKIPEGWEIKRIGDVFSVKYGKNLPKTKITESGEYPVYGAGGVIGFYNGKNVDEKTALITSRGNGSGTVWRTKGAGFVTNNSFTVVGNSEHQYLSMSFIFNTLLNANIGSSISGSAQPQITINNLDYVEVIVPDKNLVESFQSKIYPLYILADKLFLINQNLRRTRDLLLPKLITGEVEVR